MTDLRDQLRQAVTDEERCDAVATLVQAAPHLDPLGTLANVIEIARRTKTPALLLGVVAAMVPNPWWMELVENHCGHPKARLMCEGRVALRARAWHHAARIECALALARLDAMEGGSNG